MTVREFPGQSTNTFWKIPNTWTEKHWKGLGKHTTWILRIVSFHKVICWCAYMEVLCVGAGCAFWESLWKSKIKFWPRREVLQIDKKWNDPYFMLTSYISCLMAIHIFYRSVTAILFRISCLCLCLKLTWRIYCTLNLLNQVGGCIWRGQGPKPVGSSATGSQVLQMDGARVQPCGHLCLPPAHPGLRHLGHGLPRAGRAGVHPLEVLGRAQFHLALYWGPGRKPFVWNEMNCQFCVHSVWIKSVSAGRVGVVRWLPLLQQVWEHPAWTGGLPTGIQWPHMVSDC